MEGRSGGGGGATARFLRGVARERALALDTRGHWLQTHAGGEEEYYYAGLQHEIDHHKAPLGSDQHCGGGRW